MSNFADQIRSVRSFQKSASGELISVEIYSGKSKRKKPLPGLGFADKFARRLVRATAIGANELAARHERSSEKKRSGGLRKLGKNIFIASRKASKRVRLLPL